MPFMARQNTRGLELSFKRYGKGRTDGRWFKIIAGSPKYFGVGRGVSDRDSYRQALEKYEAHKRGAVEQAKVDEHGAYAPMATFPGATNWTEMEAMQAAMRTWYEQQAKTATTTPTGKSTATLDKLLTDFITEQRRRNERRHFIQKQREAGVEIQEAKREGISDEHFASLTQWTEKLRKSVAGMEWTGTEKDAAALLSKWRNESEEAMHAGGSPATFNVRIATARMFIQWAHDNYHLDHLPRTIKKLCGKYDYKAAAKSVPADIIKRVWAEADDLEKAWIALALNCGYYAKDISDLTADMLEGGYLNHVRAKTGVNVRYKLWPVTIELIRRTRMDKGTGRVWTTDEGGPLVKRTPGGHRIDNVGNNHWQRLCDSCNPKVEGYSFSNLRDTSATWVDGSSHKALTDLFIAHKDQRQARYYVDGKMADTSALDALIDDLEKHYGLTVKPEKITAEKKRTMRQCWERGMRVENIQRRVGLCRATVMAHHPK